MGKNFEKELQNLELIYRSAQNGDIHTLVRFLHANIQNPFLCIGSGGSYSVASIFEYFCTRSGGIAKKATPLELTLYHGQIKKMATVLFTAGGRNADSINAYQYISELEPEGILTCCMKANAPIKNIQRENLHNSYFEYQMPVKKDGYLAVESLVSSTVLFSRAFEELTKDVFYCVPNDVRWENNISHNAQLENVLSKETIIVLHGGITSPAAIDLESKFSEVSLGNVQLVDFRNFAHGRHFWLSDRRNTTAIIVMAGESERIIADKTLKLIPDDIPRLRLDVDDTTVVGLIEAFIFVFHLVLQAGRDRGINPGKPKVADFGKKLYHLSNNICNHKQLKKRRKDVAAMAAFRKLRGTDVSQADEYEEYARQHLKELEAKEFKGIVFDFDGTIFDKNKNTQLQEEIFNRINELLTHDIKIGIATGRGKSVREELQKRIPRSVWKNVVIAYYNGGCLSLLEDDSQPEKKAISVPKEFLDIIREIKAEKCLKDLTIEGISDQNPFQLTVLWDEHRGTFIQSQIKTVCSRIGGIKVFCSSHSMDIIPWTSSKNNILTYWSDRGYQEDDFLFIGDSGQIGGNDYEMLNRKYGLSVDRVSESPEFCWNYARPGMRNLEATCFYLEHIVYSNGGFFLKGW